MSDGPTARIVREDRRAGEVTRCGRVRKVGVEAEPGQGPGKKGAQLERKRRVTVPGIGEADGIEVGFRSSGENWNEYLLDDGTVLRLKLVVTEVLRVDGRYDREGNPIYLVRSQNVMGVSAPEELRRQP